MKNLLRFSALLILNIICNNLSNAQWFQSNGPYGGQIHSIVFSPTGDTIFTGTWGGGIFLSTDNGSSWKYSGLSNCGITSIAISPDGKNIYAGSSPWKSGIFLSDDKGVSWKSVNNGLTCLSISSLVISPDGSKIFAGTGFQGDGQGVFISTDNGSNWTAVNNGLTNLQINSLIISPDGTQLFAGTNDGVFLSTDNGMNWSVKNNGLTNTQINSLSISPVDSLMFAGTNSGIFRSIDNGSSWVHVNVNSQFVANSFTFSPDGANIYAGTWFGRGIYLSTDKGLSWNQVNNGFIGVDFGPPNILTLASSPDGEYIFIGSHGLGVFRSATDDLNWATSNVGLTNVAMLSFAFSPNDENIFAGSGSMGVFLSTDGGINWNPINNGFTGGTVNCLAINPTDSSIYAGTWRSGMGIYVSSNNGVSWTGYNPGLSVYGNMKSLAISADGKSIFAGSDGEGIVLSTNKGENWSEINSGLTNDSVYSIVVSPDSSKIFAGTFGGGVFLSFDNGSSWEAVNIGLNNINVNTLVINPDGSEIFAGTDGGIFRSINNGESWVSVNNGIPDFAHIISLAITPDGANIFAGTGWDGLYLSTDHGSSWKGINDGLPNLLVTSVAVNRSGTLLFVGSAGGSSTSQNTGKNIKISSSELKSVSNDLESNNAPFGVWVRKISDMITVSTNNLSSKTQVTNYPNPFNLVTNFSFNIPSKSFVSLKILDLNGREVASLINEELPAGNHTRQWYAVNMPNGIYFYKYQTGMITETKKLVLLRY